MRNLLKIFSKSILCVSVILTPVGAAAATPKAEETARIAELDEMPFTEMLNSVDLGKGADLVRKFQNKEGKSRLLNGKYNPAGDCTVEKYRNGEVLLITIPAHLLFAANDTHLSTKAADYLSPIRRYLREPDMYRVLLVMHTDNTGSERYREELSEDRVNAIFDWFEDSGIDTRYLFSYNMSDDQPLYPNDSMEHRDKNRRLEIYLVPGTKMADQAKKGRIAF